ncbi:hypothetical protein ABID08_006768 [Rhizobium binae]|uniref:Uncharacterized protein n=1 Tax=Rhizobium binae TaxID=1138190 RepID=A0ABV2MSD8_9HYPH
MLGKTLFQPERHARKAIAGLKDVAAEVSLKAIVAFRPLLRRNDLCIYCRYAEHTMGSGARRNSAWPEESGMLSSSRPWRNNFGCKRMAIYDDAGHDDVLNDRMVGDVIGFMEAAKENRPLNLVRDGPQSGGDGQRSPTGSASNP